MGEQKKSINETKELRREVFLVIISVSITLIGTLYGSHLYGLWKAKGDTERYLDATKDELVENKKTLDNEISVLKQTVSYKNYLLDKNSDTFDMETLRKNYNHILNYQTFKLFGKNIFEMFKGSGIICLEKDKKVKYEKLLLSLLDMYDELNEREQLIYWFYSEKRADIKEEFHKQKKSRTNTRKKQKKQEAPMYNSFAIDKSLMVLDKLQETSDKLANLILDLETRNGINVYLTNDSNYIQVASPDTIKAIKLYSPTGTLLQLFQPEQHSYQIPTKDLTEATYIVKVTTSETQEEMKVLVKRCLANRNRI